MEREGERKTERQNGGEVEMGKKKARVREKRNKRLERDK